MSGNGNTEEYPRLMGVSEIAHVLGVSRQRVHQIARGDRARVPLPEPEWRLAVGPIWTVDQVARWIRASGREPQVRRRAWEEASA